MPSEQRLVRHSASRGQAAQPCALWRCVRSIATADDCLRRNASASPATPPRMVPHPHRPALAHRSHVRRNNQTADNRVRELHDTGGARNAACGCRPNPAHAGWSPPRGAASSLNVHAEKKRGRRFKIRYSTTAAIRRNPGWRVSLEDKTRLLTSFVYPSLLKPTFSLAQKTRFSVSLSSFGLSPRFHKHHYQHQPDFIIASRSCTSSSSSWMGQQHA